MLVFGDLEQSETAGAVAGRVSARLARCRRLPPGLERHADLVSVFIDASTLVQAIADREREQLGVDELSSAQEAGAGLLLSLAEAIAASWNSNFAEFPAVDESGLGELSLPEQIRTKLPEGYAFYALYPESYLDAARRSGLGPDTTVIGIRSIGIGLAAMVAAALGAAPAISVRPVGHPFDRRIDIGQGPRARILSSAGAIAIVDEGPGLSGSSLNGVADWLVENGISEDRIHFFPSHAGDLGPEAQPAHRARWAKARKHVVEFDQLLLQSDLLEHWITHTMGPLTARCATSPAALGGRSPGHRRLPIQP
ncbi:hypothetical protein [Devosia aurantiaca]|uniref:Uncharacterized protein n=1 Tax=Devosia aurantiaca TaxID=2714858 RepID=A0A6M1STC6_9HYPH|nr:hypothetical protein [Devosia aurantiaca]NGP18612.1 hypothetical protein [Devosia aurantiaca]